MAPLMGGVGNLAKLVNFVAYRANVCDPTELTIAIRARDEAAAQQLEDIINAAMAMQQQAAAAAIGQIGPSGNPVVQAVAQYAKRVLGTKDESSAPVRKGATVTISGLNRATEGGFAVGLLLPAVQAAREAARRAQSLNNVHQIGLAMQNYVSTYGSFPARASFNAHGKPLLSWRVQILPFIGQEALYKQFQIDEPWDSEHNKPLIAMMPSIYNNPSSRTAKPGMANYLAVCGKGLMFNGPKGCKLNEIIDGTSLTIAVVEADDDRAVEWTKPQDWECDATKPLAGLGHAHPAGFVAGLADGSVRFISSSIDPATFYALLTIAGGEAVQPP